MQEVQIILPPGSVIRDRYVVEDLLGKGGFGAVYLVSDQRVKGNLFALKEMVDSNRKERDRFIFEGELLKRLDHRSLPRVYRTFTDDIHNRAYMLGYVCRGAEPGEIAATATRETFFALSSSVHDGTYYGCCYLLA